MLWQYARAALLAPDGRLFGCSVAMADNREPSLLSTLSVDLFRPFFSFSLLGVYFAVSECLVPGSTL